MERRTFGNESLAGSSALLPPTDIAVVTLPPPLPLPPPASGFTDEQVRQLTEARRRAGKIRRAALVASIDGWSIAIFAALSFICGLSSLVGMLMGVGMGIVAYIELRGGGRLRRLDLGAARMLAWNQVGLAMLLIAYGLWNLFQPAGQGVYAALKGADPALVELLGPIEHLERVLRLAVYGGLILVALFAQGGMALYYFTRVRHLEAYLMQTPAWIIQLQRIGGLW